MYFHAGVILKYNYNVKVSLRIFEELVDLCIKLFCYGVSFGISTPEKKKKYNEGAFLILTQAPKKPANLTPFLPSSYQVSFASFNL